jgi:hypothetical protein
MTSRFLSQYARAVHLVGSLRALLFVTGMAAWAGTLGAQVRQPWHFALGIGANTDGPLHTGESAIGEIGRSLYAVPRLTLDLRITGARISKDSRLCFSAQCDVRELGEAASLGLAATAGLLPSEYTPYIAGSAGVWSGRASHRRPDQPSAQNGALLVAEAGYRVKPLELGLCVHQFDGSVRHVVRLASIVVRARF